MQLISAPMKLVNTEIAAGATTFLLLVLAAALGHLNFARWDNTETFLPAIWYAHSELLSGRFPLWNPYQNLGEPIFAHGIAAVLYPPYTLAVAITKLVGWPQAAFLDVSAILHAAFGAIAMTKLTTEFGVRRSIAFMAGVGVMLSGFTMIVGSMWVHVLPNVAWSIWAMVGLRRVIMQEHVRSGIVIATLSLGIVFYTGHAQSGLNVWLGVWLWAVAFAASQRVVRARFITCLLIGVAAALIALPNLLPSLLILPESERLIAKMPVSWGFRPRAVLFGMLIPLSAGSDAALVHNVQATTFAGAWVLPGILLGALAAWALRRTEVALVRLFIATMCVALFFVWLNWGNPYGLYTALHSLPVFNKFRMAFKYWERALPLLVLAGAIGLELTARRIPSWKERAVVLALLFIAIWAWARSPANEPLAWLTGSACLLTLLVLAVAPTHKAVRWIAPLSVAAAAGMIAIGHSEHRSKPYLLDRRADARPLIGDTTVRTLPLSAGPAEHPYTRPLGLFYAPTLDRYASATAHRYAYTSRRMTEHLPADVAGVPDRKRIKLPTLLRSNWLHQANVGHLIVAPDDTAAINEIRRVWPNAQQRATTRSIVYDIPVNWPRAYFATEQVPGNAAGIFETIFGPGALSAAAVDGDERRRTLPRAEIEALEWENGRVRAKVTAPEGGLLVLSAAYSREWQATADGARTAVVPVNGMFAGVWVPAGAQSVDLSIRKWPVLLGLLGALAGLTWCLLLARSRSN